MTKYRARVGDVFAMAVAGDRVGHGQIVAKHPMLNLYVAVFRELYDVDAAPDVEQVVAGEIALLGHTPGGQLSDGDWKVIGNRKPELERIPFPVFTYPEGGPGGSPLAVTWEHETRPATREELGQLLPMASYSAVTFPEALAALHGLGRWPDGARDLLVESVRRSAEPPADDEPGVEEAAPPDGGPHGAPPRLSPTDPVHFIGLFIFEGEAAAAERAAADLAGRGWSVSVHREEELVEAHRVIRGEGLGAAQEEVERLAAELGATESGHEYSVRR